MDRIGRERCKRRRSALYAFFALLAVFLLFFALWQFPLARSFAEGEMKESKAGYFDWVSVDEEGRLFFAEVEGAKVYWLSIDGGDYARVKNGAGLDFAEKGSHALRLEAYSVSKEFRNGDELLAVCEFTVSYDGNAVTLTDYTRPPSGQGSEKNSRDTSDDPVAPGFACRTFLTGAAIGLVCGAVGAAAVTAWIYKKKYNKKQSKEKRSI